MANRKFIEKHSADLPTNFVVIEGNSWKQALSQFDTEFKKSPKNFGNYINNSYKPSDSLDKLLNKLLHDDVLDLGSYGMSNESQLDNALKLVFNDIVHAGQLDQAEQVTLSEFTKHLKEILEPLLDVWPGKTNISLQLRTDTTLSSLYTHFDLGTASKSLLWQNEAFYGSSFSVHAAFNSVSDAYLDHNHISSKKSWDYNKYGLTYYDQTKLDDTTPEGEEWYAKPWSLSVLTPNIWTHEPIASSMPRSEKPNSPEKRFMAQISVSKIQPSLI
jgi:hypothetical protein